MKRKYAETGEERLARLARERAANGGKSKRGGDVYSGQGVDVNTVMRMLEEKKMLIE